MGFFIELYPFIITGRRENYELLPVFVRFSAGTALSIP